MNKPEPVVNENIDPVGLERRVNRLAKERGDLFDRSGAKFGLSKVEQERLHSIERELDECFNERRRMRAARGARRFNPYGRVASAPRRRAVAS